MGNAKQILLTRSKEFFLLWKHYSFLYALYNILWWVCFYTRPPFCYKLSTYAIKKKTAWLNKYFEKEYSHIIDKYRNNTTECAAGSLIENPCIWVFWGQGEENMPPLVKACYKQLTSNNSNVILVTNQNVNEYIELPGIIFDKVKNGKISWANYSDIIRNSLLAKYGGLWIDATVWVSGKIPFDRLNIMEIYSVNGEIPAMPRATRFWTSFEHNWSTWCMWSGKKNNKLYSFVSEMMIAIAIQEPVWPDYVIQDYLIFYASHKYQEIGNMFNSIRSFQGKKRNELATIMDKEYSEEKYQELIKEDYFFKLSFRANWKERTAENKPTFYSHLISRKLY